MTKRYYRYEETHQTVKGVKLKRCIKCKRWKEHGEFRNDRARPDGLRVYCKTCDKAVERKRYRKNSNAIRPYLRYEERHRVVRGIKEKLCCTCNKWKYESCFHRNCRTNDGLTLQCKECHKRDSRKRLEQKKKNPRVNLRCEDRHRIVKGVKQKFCRTCNKWKAEGDFYKNKSAKGGLSNQCKKCMYKALNKSHK